MSTNNTNINNMTKYILLTIAFIFTLTLTTQVSAGSEVKSNKSLEYTMCEYNYIIPSIRKINESSIKMTNCQKYWTQIDREKAKSLGTNLATFRKMF